LGSGGGAGGVGSGARATTLGSGGGAGGVGSGARATTLGSAGSAVGFGSFAREAGLASADGAGGFGSGARATGLGGSAFRSAFRDAGGVSTPIKAMRSGAMTTLGSRQLLAFAGSGFVCTGAAGAGAGTESSLRLFTSRGFSTTVGFSGATATAFNGLGAGAFGGGAGSGGGADAFSSSISPKNDKRLGAASELCDRF
jgi:hypothetical protein